MPGALNRPVKREKSLAEIELTRYNAARTNVQVHLAERYKLDNEITRGQVIRKDELMKGLSRIADSIVSRITASTLSRNEQDDILKELASLPLVLEEAIRAQTQLRNREK